MELDTGKVREFRKAGIKGGKDEEAQEKGEGSERGCGLL